MSPSPPRCLSIAADRPAGGGDGVDDGARLAGSLDGGVAGGKDALQARHLGRQVDVDEAAHRLHRPLGVEEREVGGLPDSQDHLVGTANSRRSSPNIGQKAPESSNTEVHCTNSSPVTLPPLTITRPGPHAGHTSTPSCDGLLDLPRVGRHLVAALQADHADALGARCAARSGPRPRPRCRRPPRPPGLSRPPRGRRARRRDTPRPRARRDGRRLRA